MSVIRSITVALIAAAALVVAPAAASADYPWGKPSSPMSTSDYPWG